MHHCTDCLMIPSIELIAKLPDQTETDITIGIYKKRNVIKTLID